MSVYEIIVKLSRNCIW